MTSLSHPQPERFQFRRVLGKGGVGEVLLTWDVQRGQEVALKFVRLAETETDVVEAEKNGAQLQRELATIAPQVPQVFEEGEDSDFFYYVMEYVAGKDLSEFLRKGALAEDRAIHIAVQLLDLLIHLHSFTREIAGQKLFEVIHGDIKPENIRLQDGDRVRVMDFGIAKQLSLTRNYTRNLFGSVPYLPPERVEHGRVDVHSDLWAVAIVLYHMVSGHLPYKGTTAEAVERNILAHEILPLPSSCSRSLQWIINKALSLEVQRRFPSAAAFRDELQKLRDTGSPEPASRTVVQQSAPTQPTKAPQAAPSLPTRKTVPPPPPARVPAQPPRSSAASPPAPAKPPAVRKVPSSPPVHARPAPARKLPRAIWVLPLFLAILAVGYGVSRNEQQPKPVVTDPVEVQVPQDDPKLDQEQIESLIEQARSLVNGEPPEPKRFEALQKEARESGLSDTRIFTVLLADAYLAAGKRVLEDAGLPSGPYDKKRLWKAHSNLEEAVRNYRKAGDLGAEASGASEAMQLKNRVADILANL